MSDTLHLRCRCGKVRGTVIDVTPENGNHVVCYCDDCQAFARYLGTQIMDDRGGTEIYQTTPSQITFQEGFEHLQLLRLRENGLCRWYCRECRTPIANMLAHPRSPFVGLFAAAIEDIRPVGPVVASIQGRYAVGGCPPGVHPRASAGILWRSLLFLGRAAWKGQHQPSPFFRDGALASAAKVLSEAERAPLYSTVAGQ